MPLLQLRRTCLGLQLQTSGWPSERWWSEEHQLAALCTAGGELAETGVAVQGVHLAHGAAFAGCLQLQVAADTDEIHSGEHNNKLQSLELRHRPRTRPGTELGVKTYRIVSYL